MVNTPNTRFNSLPAIRAHASPSASTHVAPTDNQLSPSDPDSVSAVTTATSPSATRPSLYSSHSYSSPNRSATDIHHGSNNFYAGGAGRTGDANLSTKITNYRSRSRTSTITYTPPLAPVMSRENSLEDTQGGSSSSSSHLPPPMEGFNRDLETALGLATGLGDGVKGRKASKSVSAVRPGVLGVGQRTKSYHSPSASTSATPTSAPMPSLLVASDVKNPRSGLKRRISTPSMALYREEGQESIEKKKDGQRQKQVESRARSTSTSVAAPPMNAVAGPSNYHTSPSRYIPDPPVIPFIPNINQPNPPTTWAPIYVTPASPDEDSTTSQKPFSTHSDLSRRSDRSTGILNSAYELGESGINRLARWIRPSRHHPQRRDSDEDSEKGLDESEDISADSGASVARTSEDSIRRNAKYWGVWGNAEGENDEEGYFSLPPTPPEEKPQTSLAQFEAALREERPGGAGASLPTPALSTRSLSRTGSKKRSRTAMDGERDGWLSTVVNLWSNLGSGSASRSGGKTAEVLKDLGWTVALLVGLFIVTAALVAWLIQGMPITQLKHIPSSTTDLQLLSAEIRSYMASSDIGWWHTVGVLIFVGCWKHAWSVPGAVVLNILVGSLLQPTPAVLLLTLITATGSLFSYLLSRPLAPLIAVLFPKPLALVRAALAPNQIPSPSGEPYEMTNEKLTAIQVSSNPAAAPVGGDDSGSVWRRLLIMRAMGFVPWSGMNVACGVVNVDWKIFWLTTAAGSASWSYVTASVGNILSRLAIPPGALEGGSSSAEVIDGESLTSLLRDPVLIAKLVFLSGLTLIPVVLKKRNAPPADNAYATETRLTDAGSSSPMSPTSPLVRSLARFTPTPAAFDLLSFGRTAVRQGGRVVAGTARGTANAARRVLGITG